MNNIYNRKKVQSVCDLKVSALKLVLAAIFLFFGGKISLIAQTHVSVPLDHQVYYLLEQAETRGLCPPLPAVKPYTRAKILETINEILAAEPGRFGALTAAERTLLENARAEFTKGAAGLDVQNGMYRFDTEKNGVRFSGEAGIAMESLNSVGYYLEDEKSYLGTDTWGTIFFRGDIGEQFSFNMDFSGGVMRAQRAELGEYDTFATELDKTGGYINDRITTMSQPLAFIPYTYQKNWDGFMFNLGGSITAGNMEKWPHSLSIAAAMTGEMSGVVFGDMLLLRFGRMQREWGAMTAGSSLVFNAAARPFLGFETSFNPAPWFAFSTITGVLEFSNAESNKSWTSQNAFSLQQIEINYKNYLHVDFGSAAVWAKRFELGYIFPLLDNFFYQNYIGDFDNMAIHLNIKGQYPGLGKLWFSVFVDEIEIASAGRMFELDRHMFAYQAGVQGVIPWLPFTSLTLSYTKVEPYNYTHHRILLPWYNSENLMETSYVNNGVAIGHYIPPNADEIKLRLDTRPWQKTASHLQYQLIRHGADYGPHQVDGSSLYSELDPEGRSEKASLRKNFLNDGAYQWMHIIKLGISHTLKGLPVTVFGETGFVYSYFTDISDEEYARYNPTPDGETPRAPAAGEYRNSTAVFLTLGFRVFK